MEVIDRNIHLIERGTPAIIPEGEWQALGFEEQCLRLAEKKIIGLKRIGMYRVVEPRQFVGHLRLPGRAITISPSRKDLFASLHRYVTYPPDKKVLAEEEQNSSVDLHQLDPAVSFAQAFSYAVSAGLPFNYQRTSATTSRPRGRLLVNATLRTLHTRGITHKVICSSTERQYDRNLGDVLTTTVSLLKTGYQLPANLLTQVEQLVSLFDGKGRILTVIEAYDQVSKLLSNYSEPQELVKLLEICRSILSNEQIVWDFEMPISGGECRFCNMDRLWEISLLTAFRQAGKSLPNISTSFHPFSRSGVLLLINGGPTIDPDLITYKEGEPHLIIDAKYSEATGPSADDVYQIVCYVGRLKASAGILIYLSTDDSWICELGKTNGGQKILAAGVTVKGRVDLNLLHLANLILNREVA